MSARALLAQAALLADDTDVGDETHKAGPIAIVVIAILCVACFLLFRSMSKHLRRVRDDFPDADASAPSGTDASGGEQVGAPAGPTSSATSAPSGPVSTVKRPTPKSRSHPSGG